LITLNDELKQNINKSSDTEWLAKLAAYGQLQSWYDPCGKSGNDFADYVTPVTKLCLKRIVAIYKMDGRD